MNPADRVCLRQCGPRKRGFCLLPHAEQLANGHGEVQVTGTLRCSLRESPEDILH